MVKRHQLASAESRTSALVLLFIVVVGCCASDDGVSKGGDEQHRYELVEFGLEPVTGRAYFTYQSTEPGAVLKSIDGLVMMPNLIGSIRTASRGVLEKGEHASRTYSKMLEHEKGWVRLTFHDRRSTSASVTMVENGRRIEMNSDATRVPRGRILQAENDLLRCRFLVVDKEKLKLVQREEESMVARENKLGSTQIGANIPLEELVIEELDSRVYQVMDDGLGHTSNPSDGDTNNKNRRSLRAKRWTNCYQAENSSRVLQVGIVADKGYFDSFDTLEEVVRSIELVIANTNLIYYYQVNVYIVATQVFIVDSIITSIPQLTVRRVFNQNPNDMSCLDIDVALSAMRTFSINLPVLDPETATENVNLAQWTLLSNCYTSGIVGSAYTLVGGVRSSTLCLNDQGWNTAVVGKSFSLWTTYAHEMGHSFGLSHSFQRGVGTTGGIMDYGDGYYENEFQFNEEFQREDLCQQIDLLVEEKFCDFTPTLFNYFQTFDPDSECQFGNTTTCSIGECVDGICTLLQTMLSVNGTDYKFTQALWEVVSPFQTPVGSKISIAQPLDSCSAATVLYQDNIVITRAGECEFDTKAANAQAAGAKALVIYDNRNRQRPVLPLETQFTISIPVVLITEKDGNEIIQRLGQPDGETLFATIGGRPNLDTTESFPFERSPFEKGQVSLFVIGPLLVLAFYYSCTNQYIFPGPATLAHRMSVTVRTSIRRLGSSASLGAARNSLTRLGSFTPRNSSKSPSLMRTENQSSMLEITVPDDEEEEANNPDEEEEEEEPIEREEEEEAVKAGL